MLCGEAYNEFSKVKVSNCAFTSGDLRMAKLAAQYAFFGAEKLGK